MVIKIFTPGPTEVPQPVLDSIVRHKIHHKSEEFKLLYKRLVDKLKKIFMTEQNLVVLTGSGTAAMEASVLNFCSSKSRVLSIDQGRFGKRWGSICKAFGISADEVPVERGDAVNQELLESYDLAGYDVFFLTHCETSTATLTDVRLITDLIRKQSDALVIVDAITSVGAIEFSMDAWGIDCAVAASQKGLMCPPGLSVVAFSERARQKMLENGLGRYYFDLRKEISAFEEENFTSWTPSVGLFFGLDTAADLILDEGLKNAWSRVKSTAQYFRKQSVKKGFDVFSKCPSDSLTALTMPEGTTSEVLIKRMKSKHGLLIANGQDELRNKIIRISHMGALTLEDFVILSDLLQKELNDILTGS